MSSRFYPRFVKGNPQLRVFLPDWTMILMKPKDNLPSNIIAFKVDPRMTDWDIKNYLEKIYKVQVAAVNSQILAGELKRTTTRGMGITKGYDYKIAHVTLPMGQSFEWPDLFPKEKYEQTKADYESSIKEFTKDRALDPDVKLPSWFV